MVVCDRRRPHEQEYLPLTRAKSLLPGGACRVDADSTGSVASSIDVAQRAGRCKRLEAPRGLQCSRALRRQASDTVPP